MDSQHNAHPKNIRMLSMFGLPLLMAVCFGVYINGLFGGFQFDDYPNIVNNNLLRQVDGTLYHWMLSALSSHSGPLRRPISMLSFAVNFYLFGMNPIAFKLVNVVIHLLNGLLVYLLSVSLIPFLRARQARPLSADYSRLIALIVTALWMLHPLLVSNVLYVVQRMTLLSALFTFMALYCYVQGRTATQQNRPGLYVAFSGLIAFGFLAVLCKENGALSVLYAFVIELVVFRFRVSEPAQRKAVIVFFSLVLALPLALFVTYLLFNPAWLLNGYAVRPYTLLQRLLTEARVLVDYLQWIFLPRLSSMGLYHDDIALSTRLFAPTATVICVASLAGMMLLAWKARNRAPGVTFAIAWFLAGHSMESTIIPLEIVFEHRNYLPMTGLLLGSLAALAQVTPVRMRTSRVYGLIPIMALCVLAGLTARRSLDWSDPVRLALVTARDHPDSPRSLYEAGRAIILTAEASGSLDDSVRGRAHTYFARAMRLNKTYLYAATSAILTGYHHKQIPEAAVHDLAFRLSNVRLFQVTPFLSLLKAVSDGAVLMKPSQVEQLVTAALDNRRVKPDVRAMVLNDYGRYVFVVQHDAQRAVSLTLAAAEMARQNPLFQVNLTRLALALDRPEAAEAHLAKAEKRNVAGIYTKDIMELAHQIKRRKARREGSSDVTHVTTVTR